MNTHAVLEIERPVAEDWEPNAREGVSPWVSNHVLLNLSIWWVHMTRPQSPDFSTEVSRVFDSLQRDLQ